MRLHILLATCLAMLSLTASLSLAASPEGETALPRLRVAVAPMMSPSDTFAAYHRLLQYIGKETGMEVDFVQRKTHAEVGELLRSGDIDMAFICSGPYALDEKSSDLTLLAMPVVEGKKTYHSYIIVHDSNPAKTIQDLRGGSFAFTDPDSNTGYFSPLHMLRELGASSDSFFKSTIFTHSHNNSILAVARGLVDAAAVNSLVWDYCAAKRPTMTARTRVLNKSVPFAMPPVVTSASLNPGKRQELRSLLLRLHESLTGQALLRELRIDHFIIPEDEWYTTVRAVALPPSALPKEGTHGQSLP